MKEEMQLKPKTIHQGNVIVELPGTRHSGK